MEWDNDKCIQLIELYASKREIWDRHHKLYHNKSSKHEAWADIANRLDVTVDAIKGKMNSLLSSFRRERNKEAKSAILEDPADRYISKWFAYDSFHSFMYPKKGHKRPKIEEVSSKPEEPVGEIIWEAEESVHIDDSHPEEPVDHNYAQGFSVDVTPQSEETETSSFTESMPKIRKVVSVPSAEAHNEQQTFPLMQRTPTKHQGCDIYGMHVAAKLRNYSTRAQSIVQHLISGILFKADMGLYDRKENWSGKRKSWSQNVLSVGTLPD